MDEAVDTLEFLRCPECVEGVLVAVVPIGANQEQLTLDQVSLACLECKSRFSMQVDIPRQLFGGGLRFSHKTKTGGVPGRDGTHGMDPGVIEGGRV